MGEQPLHSIQFNITRTDRVAPLLDEVVQSIMPLLRVAPARLEEIAFKSKVIVSELLTNTIKHTQQQTMLLEVTIYDKELRFTRRDHSAPLHFPANTNREPLIWPLDPTQYPEAIVVYEDDLNALWVAVTAEGAIFSVTPKPAEECNINSLHEHFGLLLVALSSNRFTYVFHPDTQENIFTAMIQL